MQVRRARAHRAFIVPEPVRFDDTLDGLLKALRGRDRIETFQLDERHLQECLNSVERRHHVVEGFPSRLEVPRFGLSTGNLPQHVPLCAPSRTFSRSSRASRVSPALARILATWARITSWWNVLLRRSAKCNAPFRSAVSACARATNPSAWFMRLVLGLGLSSARPSAASRASRTLLSLPAWSPVLAWATASFVRASTRLLPSWIPSAVFDAPCRSPASAWRSAISCQAKARPESAMVSAVPKAAFTSPAPACAAAICAK